MLASRSFSRLATRSISTRNPHAALARSESHSGEDVLFHLGLSSADDLSQFRDVKYFLTGGSRGRIRSLANKVATTLPSHVTGLPFGASPTPIGSTDRYEMYVPSPSALLSAAHTPHSLLTPYCARFACAGTRWDRC
jgi:hypothetical protein